ncbi:MAG: nuclear transport factor 2 family protein [Aldersonia sp.]|nr:nuclear transport factor 2 family protein [Aldersonia sp.]
MTAPDLLALVEGSDASLAAHDRYAWLDLFADDAVVQDPVGSRPHIGRDAIGRFYDTFIGPNEIVFDVERDIVSGSTVVRDLTVRITMSTGARVVVPMHLRYELVDSKIAALYAHWELPAMVLRLAAGGLSGAKACAVLGRELVGNQGVGGALGLARGFLRVGEHAKQVTTNLLSSLARGDELGVRRLLRTATSAQSAGARMGVAALLRYATNLQWGKMIAAGRTVTTTVLFDGRPGVALLEFDALGRRIERFHLYTCLEHIPS